MHFAAAPPEDSDVVAVGVREDHYADDLDGLDRALLEAQGFTGKRDQTAVVPAEDGRLRCVVGLGLASQVDIAALRRAGAVLARACRRQPKVATTILDVAPPEAGPAAVQAVAEGVRLGAYRFGRFKEAEDGDRALSNVTIVGRGGKAAATAVARGVRIADAVCLVRDLVNTPGGTLTAPVFAEEAAEVARAAGLSVTVMEHDDIERAGLGGLLGVNRGSAQPPRLVQIRHEPERPRGFLALVGKGITFDAGGLSIKSSDGMVGMKSDMAGAATVLAAMTLLPEVAPRLRATALLPLTDNMLGPDATRVGDVLTIRNGTTVEVLNTDAEGRLILADALSLASEERPDAILDLATLTGACMIALGSRTAGIMGNHQTWIDQVRAAADTSGEAAWPLPLPNHLRAGLDSDIADLRNVASTKYGGALTAGVFLREFIGEGLPWAHLDIAGPAFTDELDGEVAKGATGYGVRLLAQLFTDWKKPGPAT